MENDLVWNIALPIVTLVIGAVLGYKKATSDCKKTLKELSDKFLSAENFQKAYKKAP